MTARPSDRHKALPAGVGRGRGTDLTEDLLQADSFNQDPVGHEPLQLQDGLVR